MFTIRTTAGLDTTAPTPETVTAILGQHLHDMATDQPIKWSIDTPAGTTHGGHLALQGKRNNAFVAEMLREIADNLAAEVRAHQADHVSATS